QRQELEKEEESEPNVRFLHAEEDDHEDELAAIKGTLKEYVRAIAERDDELRRLEEEARAHRLEAEARAQELEQARAELEGVRADGDDGADGRRDLEGQLDRANGARAEAEEALRAQEQRVRELERELEAEAARRVDSGLEAESARVELKRLWDEHAAREQRL